MILRSRSEYFKARLAQDSRRHKGHMHATSKGQSGDTAVAGSSRWGVEKVTEHVEADELEAMEQLLKLMYSATVPPDSPPDLILQCLRLADRYQAAACTDLLLAHLAAEGKDMATASVAAQLFNMSHWVQERAAFQDVQGTFKQQVLDRFRNVPDVIRSDDLRQQFCALPFAAVLAWAQSDQLQVHSENCVVYLLSAWVAAQREAGKSISAEQLEQLAHQVRVLHLGPAYQYFVLPNLEWFKGCSGMQHLPILLAYKGINGWGVSVFPAPGRNKVDSDGWVWKGPAAWVASPRQRASAAQIDTGSTLSWELGPVELQQLREGMHLASTARVYNNGFQLYISAQAESVEKDKGSQQYSEERVTLGIYYFISHRRMLQHGVTWSDTATAPIDRVVFVISGPTPADPHEAKVRVMQGSRSGLDWCGRGYHDMLRRSAPTLQELVAPLLADGKLRVEMRVAGVDLPA